MSNMNEDELADRVGKTASLSPQGASKYATELLGCLKIWGLNYSDAILVSRAMVDELLKPEAAATWKPGSEKAAKMIYGMVDSIKKGNG